MYVCICLFVCHLLFLLLLSILFYFILFYFILFYYYFLFIYRQSGYCSSSYYLENSDLGRHCLRLALILSKAGVQVVYGSRTGSLLAKSNNAIMALVMVWRRDSWRTGAPSPSSSHPSPGITTYPFGRGGGARHFKWMNSPRVCMEALCKGRKYFYIYVNIFLIAMLWSSMSMIVQ